MAEALSLIRRGDDEPIGLIVRLSEAGQLPEGARVITRFGEIMTVRVPYSRVEELRESGSVLTMEPSRRIAIPPDAEEASIETPRRIRGDAVERWRRPPGVVGTGQGVVVGVLDWGCDIAHPTFRNVDGSSRLLALWDQRGAMGSNPPWKNRWGYGRIFSARQIDAALATSNPYEVLGYDPAHAEPESGGPGSHGTAVLDIAAGNGRGTGTPGVATEAQLAFVHLSHTTRARGRGNLGDSVSLLEALDFVFEVAGDRPCVVTMSVGAHGGPHDGSTLVEQGIDQAIALQPGRAVVHSAGNYFLSNAHAQGRVPSRGQAVLRIDVPAGDPTLNEIEIFYGAADVLTLVVLDPDGTELVRAELGDERPLERKGEVLGRVQHLPRHRTSGSRHIDVFLAPWAPGGRWQLRLLGKHVVDGRYDAWIERDIGPRPIFVGEQVTRTTTTGTLCNGRLSIAVGAFDPHDPKHPLARFSSAGPTRDGRLKPELVAPGVRVPVARSTPAGEWPAARSTTKSGTSMAAPHVAGTIALMFEAAGPLEITDTRALLLSAARRSPGRRDRSLDPDDLHRRGHGELDVVAAETAARRWAQARAARFCKGRSQDRRSALTTEIIMHDSERALHAAYTTIAERGSPLLQRVQPGDLIVRDAPSVGVEYAGRILSGDVRSAEELAREGLPVEEAGAGSYVEVLEQLSHEAAPRRAGRRLVDAYGRVPRGQWILRPEPSDVEQAPLAAGWDIDYPVRADQEYGPRWGAQRPPGLPPDARTTSTRGAALPHIEEMAAAMGLGPLFVRTTRGIAWHESGGRFALPAIRFNARTGPTGWGAFEFDDVAWRSIPGVNTRHPWEASAREEIGLPLQQYASQWNKILRAGGSDLAAARGIALWHQAPARYFPPYRRYGRRHGFDAAWTMIQQRMSDAGQRNVSRILEWASEAAPLASETPAQPLSETAPNGDLQRLLAYLKINYDTFQQHERRYFERLAELLAMHGIVAPGLFLDQANFREAVRAFQRRADLTADGIPGEGTLWALQVDWAQDRNLGVQPVEADVWVRPGVAKYDPDLHGYNRFRLRQDAVTAYYSLRLQVVSAGALLTSAGSFRELDAKVTKGRSATSMHYSGLAFDLSTPTGMLDPDVDPYILTQEGGRWRVWARALYGTQRTLQAVVWKSGRTTTQQVTANVIDFTALASRHGFENIGPRACFPKARRCAEWWHFQYEAALVPWISQFGIELLSLRRYDEAKLRAYPDIWRNRQRIFRRRGGWR